MRFILALLLGLLLGAGAVYYFFVGAPRIDATQSTPGTPVLAPDANGDAPGTAVIEFNEGFFNTLLMTIFTDLGSPVFQLASNNENNIEHTATLTDARATSDNGVRFVPIQMPTQNAPCVNRIVLKQEGSGVQTGVRFADGKITAPLAFEGSYNQFGQCLNFRGAAQANIDLRFDEAAQTLYGNINVEAVNLEDVQGFNIAGLGALLNGPVTQFVQNAINTRVNPLRIIGSEQMNLALPIAATGGTLRTQVKDVRADITNALRLHITYDFTGIGGQQPSVPSAPPA
ncbi:MAG: hypothetical protein MSG64_01385 [Pyrinomonadaceae bacterium MAG19_C2-C3]|nr:hypothetical protein [Pyrinomonadaceae bacterium MAG19_C2-C3]